MSGPASTSVASAGHAAAETVMERCDLLAGVSAREDGIRRTYLSVEHRRVNDLVGAWMREAGLRTGVDEAGNLRGRLGRSDLPVLVLGSHLDTVDDAGRYDGVVGVLVAIEVAARLRDEVEDWPFGLEVIAFADEEGTRFGRALLGSSAVAGTWDRRWWDLVDPDGVTLRDAFTAFGLDPAAVGQAAHRPPEVIGYLEAHIEQAPYLELAGLGLGVVTSIASARRFQVDFLGRAGHAGTPYEYRLDPVGGAAEGVLAVERVCIRRHQSGTVGRIRAFPGGVNVVPGRASFSLDLRGEHDETRDAAWAELRGAFDEVCARRGLTWRSRELHRAPAVFCAPWLMDAVRTGIASTGQAEAPALFSRAGHDAMAMAAITDVGMLFLRNPGGISHHPDESVSVDDVAHGIDALTSAAREVAVVCEARRRPVTATTPR